MRNEIVAFAAAFAIVFMLYFLTSAPGLGLVDSGELTTAAATLGIAHPTGYPLYLLLGRLWLCIGAFNAARAMVVFSAIWGACAAGVMSALAVTMFKDIRWLSDSMRLPLSVLAVLGFALTSSTWTSVSFAEVYPLTWLIAALLLLMAARFESAAPGATTALPYMICYLFGLGFGNHFTNLWFVPLVMVVVFRWVKNHQTPMRALIYGALLFLLGFSVNLYLPVRSSAHPLLDWSNPATFDGLIRHLTAWQYRVWMFEGGWSGLFSKLGHYFIGIPGDVGWGITLLACIGLASQLKKRSPFVMSAFLVWIIGVTYNLNYSIPDISTYFISLYAALFVLALAGFVMITTSLERWVKSPAARNAWAIALVAALPLFGIASAKSDGLQSSNTFARDYAAEILRTLPANALVIHPNWDIQSPAIYLQNVEKYRSDVVMLDLNLLMRPWYLRQEMRNYPSVFTNCQSEIKTFIREVRPFENGQPYDGQRIEAAFVAMVRSIISTNLASRPVYIRDEVEAGHHGIMAGFQKIPGAYFLRVAPFSGTEPILQASAIRRGLTTIGERENYLLDAAAMSAMSQCRTALKGGDTTTAKAALSQAELLVSDNPDARRFIADTKKLLNPSNIP
jgi:hypothetical protein